METERQFIAVSTRQFLGIQFYHYEAQEGVIHFNLGSKMIFGVFVKDLTKIITSTAVIFEFLSIKEKQNKTTTILKGSLKLHYVPEGLKGYLSLEEKKGFKYRPHLFLVRSTPPNPELAYYGTITLKDLLQNCRDCYLIYNSETPYFKTKKNQTTNQFTYQRQIKSKTYSSPAVQILADFRIKSLNFQRKA